MKYYEAVEELMSGKYVTRSAWLDRCAYLVDLPGLENFLRVNIVPKVEVFPWAVNKEDTLATDWEVIVPNHKKAEVVDAA